VIANLHHRWQGLPGVEHIERILLHYLDGKIHVEVWLPDGVVNEKLNDLVKIYTEQLQDMFEIADVRLLVASHAFASQGLSD